MHWLKQTGRKIGLAVCLVLGGIASVPEAGATEKMYWTDAGTLKIQRANLDGSGVEDVVTGVDDPRGLTLDVTGGKMYWVLQSGGKIQRANLDGTAVEDLVTGLGSPRDIALDVTAGKMYWVNLGSDKIQRANLDGSGVEDLVTSGLDLPLGIALDLGASKMYWTDAGTNKIQRANLDGSVVEDLVTTGLVTPTGIALDVTGGKMYWTDQETNKIRRANLDGTGVEDLITDVSGADPVYIALDLAASKMYWTDTGIDKIQRANLDGSGVEELISSGLNAPLGIALLLESPVLTFTFTGFFAPVDNPPVVNQAKAGQAIPVKWQLTLAGEPVSDPSSFVSVTSYGINCGTLTGNPASAIEEYAAGSSALQYLGNGVWQFNWKTIKSYGGTCRTMVLTLSDNSVYTANFNFK